MAGWNPLLFCLCFVWFIQPAEAVETGHQLSIPGAGLLVTLPPAWGDHFVQLHPPIHPPNDVHAVVVQPLIWAVAGHGAKATTSLSTVSEPAGEGANSRSLAKLAAVKIKKGLPVFGPILNSFSISIPDKNIIRSLVFHRRYTSPNFFASLAPLDTDVLNFFILHNGVYTSITISTAHASFQDLYPELRAILTSVKSD